MAKVVCHEELCLDVVKAVRHEVNQDVVDDYMERYQDGEAMPPAVAFWDEDAGVLWAADGLHRYHGSLNAGLQGLPCEVKRGTRMEALEFAIRANASHGLRRSPEDKRACVAAALEAWPMDSDRALADKCCVSHTLVWGLRRQLKEAEPVPRPKYESLPSSDDGVQEEDGPPPRPKEPKPELPEHLAAVSASDLMDNCLKSIKDLRRFANKAADPKLFGKWLKMAAILQSANEIENHLENAEWHRPCPACKGKKKGCGDCRNTGWMPKWRLLEWEASQDATRAKRMKDHYSP